MSNRPEISTTLSADVVTYLVEKGITQADLATAIGVTEGHISHVRAGRRTLSEKQLEAMAKKLRVPLGVLLIEATRPKKVTPEMKPLFEATEAIMARLNGFLARHGR